MRTKSPNHEVFTKAFYAMKGMLFTACALAVLALFANGCAKDADVALEEATTNEVAVPTDGSISSRATPNYAQFNLVSDVDGYGAGKTDANLVNAWGMAMGPSQEIWVTSTGADKAVIYNHAGTTMKAAIDVEGEPIGIVYNESSGFKMPGSTNIARYIFATDQGDIAAWTPWEPNETTVVYENPGSAYTGLEIAKDHGYYYLYAANVGAGTIDVFDRNFKPVTNMSFDDPNLPAGARPFNIRLINDKLFVTYVGPGGGYVNMFKTDGTFIKRFASGGTLAAPWGITKTPLSFGMGYSILVGNFGDGRINVYDYNGNYKGQMTDENGNTLAIDGLWALSFTNTAMSGTSDAKMYFTAGPDSEEHGLFGYLEKAD